jgi:serine protease
MRAFVLLACLALASAIAPLYRHQEVEKDSYIVVFNVHAPHLLSVAEVSAWLATQKINANVTASYFIKTDKLETSFRGFAATLEQAALSALLEHEYVQYVEENLIVRLHPVEIPEANASAAEAVWSLQRADQHCLPYSGNFDPCAGIPDGSDCTGKNAVIWVTDTGIRVTHSEFVTNGKSRASIAADYAAGDASAYNGDCNGHGTHCAGTAAGNTYGVAPQAELRSVRVLNCQGSGTSANVLSGYDYVAKNQVSGKRNIMSVSLGSTYSASSNSAITAASDAGVLVVVAAGNDNKDASGYSPASADRVVCVGATDKADIRSTFSNYGALVDVFAPGTSITSAWYTSDTATNTISGTSMATPLVSGSVALIPQSTVGKDVTPSVDAEDKLSAYTTQGVLTNIGTGSKNRLIYDKWNDGTTNTCK